MPGLRFPPTTGSGLHNVRADSSGGGRNVLVSMAGFGALLVTETGEVLRQRAAQGALKNSVGAGDSMVAGFLAGYSEKGDYRYALRLGTAAGGATAFSDGLAVRSCIEEVLKTL